MTQATHLDIFLWSGEGAEHEDIDLYVRSFGAVFLIIYNRQQLSASKAVYTRFLHSLRILRGDNHQETETELESLQKPFAPLMTELAPRPPISTSLLYDYLYPQWFLLKATAAQDDVTVQPQRETQFWRHDISFPGEFVTRDRRYNLRELVAPHCSYSSRQIQLLPRVPRVSTSNCQLDPCLRGPERVLVGDTVYHFKGWAPGRGREGVSYYELQAYRKIADACTQGIIPLGTRICRLHGVVVDHDCDIPDYYPPNERDPGHIQDSGRLAGILLTYIENKGTLDLVAPWPIYPEKCRLHWAQELELLIHTLHAAGVVWGDAKPENVLVDTMDNLWLIDFGGSYTQGWVDGENRETKEGDIQGLERIKEWLIKCSEKPVRH